MPRGLTRIWPSWLAQPLRRGPLALAVALAITACAGSTPTEDAAQSEPFKQGSSSNAEQPDEIEPPSVGAATWPLIDAVPAYRKGGLFVKAGLDYEPVLASEPPHQRVANLRVAEPTSGLVMLPSIRGQVPFDQIQIASPALDGTAVDFLALAITDATAFLFASSDRALASCSTFTSLTEALTQYGVVDTFNGLFDGITVECAPLVATNERRPTAEASELLVGSLPQSFDSTVGFGVLIDHTAPASIELEWLALADSSQSQVSELISVEVVNLELALASQSTTTEDDATLNVLLARDATNTVHQFTADSPGTFTIDTTKLQGPAVQLWFDDYGLQHYARPGGWIDLRHISRTLTIDLAQDWVPVEFQESDTGRSRKPHRHSLWRGSPEKMELQEYRGETFTNNYGRADRDRTTDNSNECRRYAFFGGSFIEAIQTRVDQKPGIVAEALLDHQLEGCFELFTIGNSLFSPENHFANAQELVQDFGVTTLIFSVADGDLCRMEDSVYEQINGVAADTPNRWRVMDGASVPPVLRGDAVAVEKDPDFARYEVCFFNNVKSANLSEEEAVIETLAEMDALLSALSPNVEVVFYNFKNAHDRQGDVLNTINELCLAHPALICRSLTPPEEFDVPEGADTYSPNLYGYRDDDHPNPRANQRIGAGLAALIEELERAE